MAFTTRFVTPSGYSRSISARDSFVKSLPIDNVNETGSAFLDVKADGSIAILDPYATGGQNSWRPESPAADRGILGHFKKLLKGQESIGKENKNFNHMISIGGWNNSAHFSDAFSTEERRTTFVNSLSHFLATYPVFNSIYIDWEYVSDNGINYGKHGNSVSTDDGENFILVLQKLRDALPGFTLASCCNAAPEKNHWPIKRAAELLDELHVITYDFHDGHWGETQAAHHTNHRRSSAGKWSAEEAVEFFLGEGVPASKIFIGGPLSSRGLNNTAGIGQPASGGSPHKSWEHGVVDSKVLPTSGSTEMWDDEGKATYAYDATAKRVNPHDNVTSILKGAKLVKDKKLGGIILWETLADMPYDPTNYRSIGQPTISGRSPHKSSEDGAMDYKVLPTMSGSTEMWDDEGKATYAYDATAKPMDTHDNATSILEGAKFVREKKLGGTLLWETRVDMPYDEAGKATNAHDATAKHMDTHDTTTSILQGPNFVKAVQHGGTMLFATPGEMPSHDHTRTTPS